MTAKPVLYVCNVEEGSAATGNEYSEAVEANGQGAKAPARVVISATIEEEIAQLPDGEREDFSASPRPGRARPQPPDPRGL